MKTEELIIKIQKQNTWVYGTGFVAERFTRALEEHGLSDAVCGYVVSGQGGGRFYSHPIYSLEEFAAAYFDTCPERRPLICIAVHESILPEIEHRLQEKGITDYTWIYANYLELVWGNPVRENLSVTVRDILKHQSEDQYWITVRYAAMRERMEGRSDGVAAQIYERLFSLFSTAETACKRLDVSVNLVRQMRANGYDAQKPILMDTQYRIIDGLHRLAAAVLLGIEQIPCIVVSATDRYEDYISEEVRLPQNVLRSAGLTEEEICYLDKMKEFLTGGQKKIARPAISVIIPVYNVADYIDVCMESVVGQTMSDFEVLLISDGSTDASPRLCLEWQRKDTRITYFDCANSGVARARNFGIRMAQGEYLAFVDPDDWLELTYLDKLYKAAVEEDADFVECDLWRYNNRTGKQIYRSCYGRMGRAYTLREHMKYGPTATYKAISRRSIWIDNQVEMPSCSYESPAVYSLILGLSNKVVNVREALYYYRRFRENSLVENGYEHKDGSVNNTLAIDAMDFLKGEFERTGLLDVYDDILEGIIKYRLSDILATQFYRKSREDFLELTANYHTFLGRAFPQGYNDPYLVWGGYNLNKIMTHMNWLHDPYTRFNFSSLISCADGRKKPWKADHNNNYRRIMLEREMNAQFLEVAAEVSPTYVFIDLIEERFDVLEMDGCYLTLSDAFEGALFTNPENRQVYTPEEMIRQGRVISRSSEECTRLWQKSCRKVITDLKTLWPDIRFVIVENYLSESVGDLNGRRMFEDIQNIRGINTILKGYYAFMKSIVPEAAVIACADDELYFTDVKYEYGAVPSHLNEIENQRIAEKIIADINRMD